MTVRRRCAVAAGQPDARQSVAHPCHRRHLSW